MKKVLISSLRATMFGAIAGIFIGFWMCIIFNASAGNFTTLLPSGPTWTSHFSSVLVAFIMSAVLWMLMGVVFSLSSYWLFAENPWNLGITATTFIHFIITSICSILIAFATGWYSISWSNAINFMIIFTVIYLIIWGINMLIYRAKVRELNRRLNP
ncbi:DUF3021 domain-containing protein [Alloscardovia venturai]|uniref:DUF3021 domain-containing protein n=1 Tax=Alloscardovia venturai TaxID=1769421 RepID=A0ABW2Y4Y6_9BIFI